MEKNLAYRFRESTFRQYETHIHEVVDRYPDVVMFKPPNLETFSCRFRDSMKSLVENGWETSIDIGKLLASYNQIAVSIRGDIVLIGNRTSLRAHSTEPTPTPTILKETIIDPSLSALEALMVLHHERVAQQPTHVRFTYPAPDLKTYEQRFDVAIDGPDVNNIWTIL